MPRILCSHDFCGLDYIIPLERSQRLTRADHRVALLKVGFLFDGPNRIGVSGQAFVDCVLEKTATNPIGPAHQMRVAEILSPLSINANFLSLDLSAT